MPEIELMAEPEETAKESESFASLFKSKNYKAFIDRFYYWAYSKIEYLIILLFLILDIIATYGYWWVPFHLVYEGTTTVNLYTSISAAVFLIMTLIMIPIIISGFWYLFVFLILISNMQLLKHKIGVRLLDFLRLKKPSTTQDESSLELSDLFNIYIYNKNESKNKSPDSTNQNSRELSYSMFYLRFKSIGNVVMAITLKFLLGVTILAFVIGIDQLFNYKKPDYYSIAFIVVFALFIYLLFISVQGGLFVILRNLKMQSLKNLEKVYFDKQKEFYKIINAGESSQEDKEKLEKIQIVLGLLDNVIEKEKNTPVWLINVPTFVSLLGAVIPTAIGLGIQFLGIL